MNLDIKNNSILPLFIFLIFFGCNQKDVKQQNEATPAIRYEHTSELGVESFTFNFKNDSTFIGTYFSTIKEADTVNKVVAGSLNENGTMHFTTRDSMQSIEYRGKLSGENLVLYQFELQPDNAHLRIKENSKPIDSVTFVKVR